MLVKHNISKGTAEPNAGAKLHQLRVNLNGHWSIRVNGNWRVTFRFEGVDIELVNYLDYH